MNVWYSICLVLAVAVAVYLVRALLRAEDF
jgi:K+-transporting ATPase KdpF subunit